MHLVLKVIHRSSHSSHSSVIVDSQCRITKCGVTKFDTFVVNSLKT
jgi:hypothetical protein